MCKIWNKSFQPFSRDDETYIQRLQLIYIYRYSDEISVKAHAHPGSSRQLGNVLLATIITDFEQAVFKACVALCFQMQNTRDVDFTRMLLSGRT